MPRRTRPSALKHVSRVQSVWQPWPKRQCLPSPPRLPRLPRHPISLAALAVVLLACSGSGEAKRAWKEISILVDEDARTGLADGERSSEGQDLIALELLSAGPATSTAQCPRRFFVELAAFNGFHLSNTFTLERAHAWHGLCIEGNREHLARLAERGCVVVSALVAGE